MIVDKSKRGLVRPLRGGSRSAQEAALLAAGAGVIDVIGTPGCETWREFVRALRPGNVVLIDWLWLLARSRGQRVAIPSQDLRDAIEAIEARGASIHEVSTGRSSAVPEQRAAMIADAVESLRKGRVVRKGVRGQAGPKPFDWDAHKDLILREFDSRTNATTSAVMTKLKAAGVPKHTSYSTIHRKVKRWRGGGYAGRDSR